MAQREPGLQLDDGRVEFESPSSTVAKTGKRTPRKMTSSETASLETASLPSNDTSIKKISAAYSPRGKHGQKYLVSGISLAMRLWEEEQPGRAKAKSQREYETVGYVISGRAELHIAQQIVVLEPGDSWLVPKGVVHHYKILEPFTAIEVTCPPARIHDRDS